MCDLSSSFGASVAARIRQLLTTGGSGWYLDGKLNVSITHIMRIRQLLGLTLWKGLNVSSILYFNSRAQERLCRKLLLNSNFWNLFDSRRLVEWTIEI